MTKGSGLDALFSTVPDASIDGKLKACSVEWDRYDIDAVVWSMLGRHATDDDIEAVLAGDTATRMRMAQSSPGLSVLASVCEERLRL
jgi:hypothetical protein